jgi:hypothetical protein
MPETFPRSEYPHRTQNRLRIFNRHSASASIMPLRTYPRNAAHMAKPKAKIIVVNAQSSMITPETLKCLLVRDSEQRRSTSDAILVIPAADIIELKHLASL